MIFAETMFQQFVNIFRHNPTYQYRPSQPTARGIVNNLLETAAGVFSSWDTIDVSEKLGYIPSLSKRRQFVMIRSDLAAVIEKLIQQHAIVTEPSEVSLIVDGVTERIIHEFYSGDLHINTTHAVRTHLKDGAITVIMLKLWSDVTCLGGNDRLPVRIFMVSLCNHPLAFSKSDAGQVCVAMANEAIKDGGKYCKYCLTTGSTFITHYY